MEYQPQSIDPETTETDTMILAQRFKYVKTDGSDKIVNHPMFVNPDLRFPSVDASLNNAIRANNSGTKIPIYTVADEFAARDAMNNLLNLPPEEFASKMESHGESLNRLAETGRDISTLQASTAKGVQK